MKFFTSLFNKDFDVAQDVLINIAKYSSGELIITDEKFNIIFHNSKYIVKKQQKTFYDIAGDILNDNVRINIENFKNSKNSHLLLKLLLNADDESNNIPVDVHICKILNRQKKVNGFYIIIQDITHEIKNRILRETFIDILSHDLKNPIRANIQILELILNNKFGELNHNLKTILDELLSSCKFMNYMTDNLLIKYKNEFNLYELQKQKYSIVKLVKEQCSKLSTLLDRKKQNIEFIVNGNINDVEIDVNEIGKVVNNLIINASEQSNYDSTILVNVEQNENKINVCVTDYGYKENKAKLDDLFEEYISCSNKFRKVGFSLELYNCRQIIEAHNGNILAKNSENRGTSITFSIPV